MRIWQEIKSAFPFLFGRMIGGKFHTPSMMANRELCFAAKVRNKIAYTPEFIGDKLKDDPLDFPVNVWLLIQVAAIGLVVGLSVYFDGKARGWW